MENETLLDQGIIYCATGERFVQEAMISAKTVKTWNSSLKISIFIDEKTDMDSFKDLFYSIHIIKNPEYSFSDKIQAIIRSPYKKSIFLDTDIIAIDDISELFMILENYDLAIANRPFKNKHYPNFNTGVIAFSKNNKNQKFFEAWEKGYDRINDANDQPSFQRAVSNSNLSIFTLPPKYNFRLKFASYAQDKIKLVHDHDFLFRSKRFKESIIDIINRSHNERYWFPNKGYFEFPKKLNFWARLLIKLEEDFLIRIKKIWNFFPRKKLINFFIIKSFPWFINWVVTKQYRDRMIKLDEKIKKLSLKKA